MFGQNEKVGKGFFAKSPEAQAGKLQVTSLFFTLQGEGPLRGEPAVFIRLAQCQLACSFCDTYFSDGTWLTPFEIIERCDQVIRKFFNPEDLEGQYAPQVPAWAKGNFPLTPTQDNPWRKRKIAIVITGGEPSLQENLKPLLLNLNMYFHKSQIESNGLLPLPIPKDTIAVISPKCLEKDGKAVRYFIPNPETLERADCLKFVMEADGHWLDGGPESGLWISTPSPYSTIPDWAHAWAERTGKPVFCSPMNVYRQEPKRAKELRANNNETTIEQRSDYEEVISFWEEGLLDMAANKINHEYAARYAIRHGFIFGVQIHLLASVA